MRQDDVPHFNLLDVRLSRFCLVAVGRLGRHYALRFDRQRWAVRTAELEEGRERGESSTVDVAAAVPASATEQRSEECAESVRNFVA